MYNLPFRLTIHLTIELNGHIIAPNNLMYLVESDYLMYNQSPTPNKSICIVLSKHSEKEKLKAFEPSLFICISVIFKFLLFVILNEDILDNIMNKEKLKAVFISTPVIHKPQTYIIFVKHGILPSLVGYVITTCLLRKAWRGDHARTFVDATPIKLFSYLFVVLLLSALVTWHVANNIALYYFLMQIHDLSKLF